MAIKKYINVLNIKLAKSGDVLNFLTTSKKAHFTISEAKLADALIVATNHYGMFRTFVSTYPHIAVHICGRADNLEAQANWLEERVKSTLDLYFTNGAEKIKN